MHHHLSSLTHTKNANEELTQRIFRPKKYVTGLPPSTPGLTSPASSEFQEISSGRKKQQLDEITKALDQTHEPDPGSLMGIVFDMKL